MMASTRRFLAAAQRAQVAAPAYHRAVRVAGGALLAGGASLTATHAGGRNALQVAITASSAKAARLLVEATPRAAWARYQREAAHAVGEDVQALEDLAVHAGQERVDRRRVVEQLRGGHLLGARRPRADVRRPSRR
jgi:hypothetical protein